MGDAVPTGYDDDDDLDEGTDLVRDLRAQIKALKSERDKAAQEAADFRMKARQSTVQELLQARGVKPGIAKFIPEDIEGTDAVNAWLEENAELFGVTLDPGADALADAETAQESGRLQALGSAAVPPGKVSDLTARLEAAQSNDEVDAIWAEAQSYAL